MIVPRATYRLQFHRDFTFAHATAIVPYLAALGVSHVYASPCLKARPGSVHGYDIIDHNAINPEIGTAEELDAFVTALHRYGLRQMMDIVPNHMGVMEADNRWWLDVLENGRSSRYAEYFDIDWEPQNEELRDKVLLPVLGDQYGTVLERGELRVSFDAIEGEFSLRYFEHRFPVDPRGYARIVESDRLPQDGNLRSDPATDELDRLLRAFAELPTPREEDSAGRNTRAVRVHALKRQLAELCLREPAIVRLIDGKVTALNGHEGDPASFDRLHGLIKSQAFRVAYWRVAADDINYRRFFDINDLAALRMEYGAVFEDTHRLVRELVASGTVDALRVDHPDGLYDPRAYFARLEASMQPPILTDAGVRESAPSGRALPLYLVIEKILAEHERLRDTWTVHGTTGYEFSVLLNGLFVDRSAATRMERAYHAFIGERRTFDEVLWDAKMIVMRTALSSELNVLANLLHRIAKADRHTCDFTLNSLRQALAEIVACFPVYRTYISDDGASKEDREYVGWAVALAAKRHSSESSVFEFIRNTLLAPDENASVDTKALVRRFAGRFQQFTSPVMAKGMEDTSFYRYNRLVSLNDVGGDPRTFGVTLRAFHRSIASRARAWPHTMLASSTHDSKRSEDVRARINVLSEMPAAWRLALRRWSRMNRRHKQHVDGNSAPTHNDEYLLYQTLLGAWPLTETTGAALDAFQQRIQAYMQKAAREAKELTSWTHPNVAYENALNDFVAALLSPVDTNLFLKDFLLAQQRLERPGLYNGLSQTLIKLASPGVPDIYQGNELWELNLVDPDNRRPVDYGRRDALLREMEGEFPVDGAIDPAKLASLLDGLSDGRAKLYLIWRVLALRKRDPELFERGDYRPLFAVGDKADHVCAFARAHADRALIAIAARFFYRLNDGENTAPLGIRTWRDTRLVLPDRHEGDWRNVLTGASTTAQLRDGRPTLSLSDVLQGFPVALLVSDQAQVKPKA